MVSRWVRTWVSKVFRPCLSIISSLRITPNQLTIGSLVLSIIAGLLFAFHLTVMGIVALVVGGLLDVLDGELARFNQSQTPFGSFLDSVCDHYGDLALYLGFLWRFFQGNDLTGSLLVMLAMFGSVFGSHVRSRAGMAGIDLKRVGLFTRLERILVMIAGAAFNQLTLAFWVLAIMNNVTAFQRIIYTARRSRQRPNIPQP